MVGFSFETNTLALRKAGYTRNIINREKKKKEKIERAVFCGPVITITLLISWPNKLVL